MSPMRCVHCRLLMKRISFGSDEERCTLTKVRAGTAVAGIFGAFEVPNKVVDGNPDMIVIA
jgi:hypothetical protein